MSKIMAQLSKLDNLLLAADEEEYDKIAAESVQQLSKGLEESHNLDDLDSTTQTILYLFNLSHQLDASIKSGKAPSRQLPSSVLPEGRLWNSITKILLHFDPIQVRYVGSQFNKVIELVVRGAEQAGDYVPAIQLLEQTILRLDSSSSSLTSTHYAYLRLCLLANAYDQAIPILDRAIYHVPSADISRQLGGRAYKHLCAIHDTSATYLNSSTRLTQKITTRIHLEYFLLGAMCYLGAGMYKKALHFLETVLTAPTIQNAISLVQLEAYKKWLLVNLLVNGAPGTIPRALSQTVVKNLRAAAKPYECIADAFKSGKIERIQGEIREGLNIWQEDENYGLIYEVFAAFRKYAVLNLAKTYAALPIEEVTRLASLDPKDVDGMMAYVASLVQSGELQAEVIPSEDSRRNILRFASEQDAPIPETMVDEEMERRTQELQALLRNVTDLDHQFEIHKEYIDYLQKLRNARDRAKKNESSGNRGVTMDIHDEDMMDDL